MVSPFSEGAGTGATPDEGIASGSLPLTHDSVNLILDEVRPFMQSDGGDCRLVYIDGSVVGLELQGACSSCSASSVTLKMGIETALCKRIPEVSEVVAVQPGEEPLTEATINEVLDHIRPILAKSGGTIELREWFPGPAHPRVVLAMGGPPAGSTAVRVEVIGRFRRQFSSLHDVVIVPVAGGRHQN